MEKIKEVTDYIEQATEEQKEILISLRDLIAKTIPSANESFKWSRPVYSIEKDFCYLQFTKKHINLGFFNFEKIEDPNNLIEGTGQKMRHIKIKNQAAMDKKILAKMVKQAAKKIT